MDWFETIEMPASDFFADTGGPLPDALPDGLYPLSTTGDFARMDRGLYDPLPPESGEDLPTTGDFARMDRLPVAVSSDTQPQIVNLPDGSFVLRPRGGAVVTASPPSEDAFTRSLDRLVEVGVAAIRLNQAYRQAGAPAPRVSGAMGGVSTVAGRDGWLTTTTSAGVTRRKPDVGQPYVTVDGSMILNNGNGTYDLIGVDGSRQTLRYAGMQTPGAGALAALPAVSPALLIGGALALLMLARR